MTDHTAEIEAGNRFEFGKNWRRFLETLDESRIATAEQSLLDMLGPLTGKRFLDVGCGSGLFSLAAHRLGAIVRSFDYDPNSVACTRELQRRFDAAWPVEEGSVLDLNYLRALGKFDIVYSWGVLHHTGDMYRALELVSELVKDHGKLFIAIYNDQGWASAVWHTVKALYNRLPWPLRILVLVPAFARLWGPALIRDALSLKPTCTWKRYRSERGMSPWHDVVDWVGGYPFQVASPADIFNFFKQRGFTLTAMKTQYGHGCNEFVLAKVDVPLK